jgi:hypothetical protein
MLGKTFKGLTDKMLQWQTKKLLELEVGRDEWAVYVRPELVVEIAFNDIQKSPRYPGGLALRFARVKSFRVDKSPSEADTFQKVRTIFKGSREWSPTGLPVVPNNPTRLRHWSPKRFGAQPPRLRRVIRPAAESAEARQGYIGKSPS